MHRSYAAADLITPEVIANPYPAYEALLKHAHVQAARAMQRRSRPPISSRTPVRRR